MEKDIKNFESKKQKNGFEQLLGLVSKDLIQENSSALQEKIEQLKNNFYAFTFKIPLKNLAPAEVFWKVLKIKAKKANLFAENIIKCDVIKETERGFIREIDMKGPQGLEQARERVIIDEATTTILFFILKTTGKNKLVASNSIREQGNDFFFAGTYVLDIERKPENREIMKHIDKAFTENLAAMMKNIQNFIAQGAVDTTYRELFAET